MKKTVRHSLAPAGWCFRTESLKSDPKIQDYMVFCGTQLLAFTSVSTANTIKLAGFNIIVLLATIPLRTVASSHPAYAGSSTHVALHIHGL